MKHFLPNGDELIIRVPRLDDAAGLLSCFQRLTRETDYLLFTYQESMELDLLSEQNYIQSYLGNPNQLLLLAIVKERIIGSINLYHSSYYKKNHTVELGIAIESEYNNMGIGRRLMTAMLRWAEDHPVIQLIYLHVFSNNEKALQLYRNFGFLECGRLPQGIMLRNNTYVDLITMYKRVKPAAHMNL